jgi:hypothetical protein
VEKQEVEARKEGHKEVKEKASNAKPKSGFVTIAS